MSQQDDLTLEAGTESNGGLTPPPLADDEDIEAHGDLARRLPATDHDTDEEDTEGHKIRGK